MRILFLTGIFPNRVHRHRGLYILNQAVALKRRAHVAVIAPVPYFPGSLRSRKYSAFSNIPKADTIEGIDVIYPRYFVVPKLFRIHHGVCLTVSVFDAFRRTVRQFRPDVIIGFFAYPYGYATVQLAKMLKVPVVIGVLGSDVNIMAQSGLKRLMIRWALNASDKVFSVSQALKDATVEIGVGPEKVVVIPNGVDTSLFGTVTRSEARTRLELPDSKRIVLCVANLARVKGVDLVIQAFGLVRDDDMMLMVVGDGEQEGELRRMVRDLKLKERVHFAGAKTPKEVPLWMAASDLVVLGSRAEGHPNVIVEALASGRPVVATGVGGVSETVTSQELGLVVEPEDSHALAEAIRKALSRTWDEEAIRRVGVGRTWDDVAGEIITELEPLTTARVVGNQLKR